MAKSKSISSESPTTLSPSRQSTLIKNSRDCCLAQPESEVLPRSAKSLGRLIRDGMVDGVSQSSSRLFKGQYDEEFGVVDIATDIHQDPHLIMSQIMEAEVSSVTKNENDE